MREIFDPIFILWIGYLAIGDKASTFCDGCLKFLDDFGDGGAGVIVGEDLLIFCALFAHVEGTELAHAFSGEGFRDDVVTGGVERFDDAAFVADVFAGGLIDRLVGFLGFAFDAAVDLEVFVVAEVVERVSGFEVVGEGVGAGGDGLGFKGGGVPTGGDFAGDDAL